MVPLYKEGEVQKVNLVHGASLFMDAPAEIQIPELLKVAKAGKVKVLVANIGILQVTFSDGSKWTDQTLATSKQFMNGEMEKNTPCEVTPAQHSPTPKHP